MPVIEKIRMSKCGQLNDLNFYNFFSVVCLMQKIKVGIGGHDEEFPSRFFFRQVQGRGLESLGIGQPSCSLKPATLHLQVVQAADTQPPHLGCPRGGNPPPIL